MEDLIKALQIFLKYNPPAHPTHCEHDVLYVLIDPFKVTDEDKEALKQLGFLVTVIEGDPCFKSYRFGSA